MKNFKTTYKNGKNNHKFWWYWSQKTKEFDQHKRPILIDNIDVNKIIVSNKNDFKYFIGYTDAKKISLYLYFFWKWVHLE